MLYRLAEPGKAAKLKRLLRIAATSALVLMGAGLLWGAVVQAPMADAQRPAQEAAKTTDGQAAQAGESVKAQQNKAAPKKVTQVTDAGQNVSVKDLLNPATAGLRLTYWKVGLAMFMDNFFTGVGLGNFGVAYYSYQPVGAPYVKEAHNGFLQAFSETGILGGSLFCFTWIYFLVWGARRILAEQDRQERIVLVALYTGILAFLLHSLVDLNFSLSTNVMYFMILCGLFCARTILTSPSGSAPSEVWQ